jgi:hypothetical protein
VRNFIVPRPDIESVNAAIDVLVGSYLLRAGSDEGAAYQVTLRGLLASHVGTKALHIIDRAFDMLQHSLRQDASLFRFGWVQLRAACGLPEDALNLADLSLARAHLGTSRVHGDGDYWWRTPADLDVTLDLDSALDHLHRMLASDGASTSQQAPSGSPSSGGNVVVKKQIGSVPDPSVYVSAKVSKQILTFAPRVFDVPEAREVEGDLVAVMMPFAKEFDGVRDAIKRACEANGMRCLRADDIWEESTIIQDIFNLILRARVVVVDFSGKNPNVMYECGIAHTLGKDVVPITQSRADVPFDTQHHRAPMYLPNSEGLRELERLLTAKLKQYGQRVEEPSKDLPLRERVVLALRQLADHLGEVTSTTDEVAALLNPAARPGDVHQALLQLKQDGQFRGFYAEGTGDFNLTLR